jgi:hypothetical protein
MLRVGVAIVPQDQELGWRRRFRGSSRGGGREQTTSGTTARSAQRRRQRQGVLAYWAKHCN